MNRIFIYIQKYKNCSAAAKASLWFIFCNFVLKGIGFITVPIFTRLLNPSEYGLLSVFLSYEQIILTLATWETALSAYQKGLFKYKEKKELLTSSTIIFCNCVTICFFVIVFINSKWFSSFTGLTLHNQILLFIYMILQPAYSCWIVQQRTEFKYKSSVVITILFSIVTVLIPLIAVLHIGQTADIKLMFTLIASIGFYLYFYVKNIKPQLILGNLNLFKEQFWYLLKYQAPLVIHALSFTVLAQADRVMISKMIGNSEAALYSIAYTLGAVMSIIQNSINQSLVPWRFQKLEKKQYKDIRSVSNFTLILIAGIVIAFCLVAIDILHILFTEDYYDAIWCIPPIALSVFFMFIYTLFVWVENYYEKTKYVAYVSVVCALVNILLNYILIQFFGYIACAYTTVISYILFCLGHYFFMKKTCIEAGLKEEIYDIKFILIISIITSVLTLGIMLIYPYPIVRYFMLAIVLFISFKKRNLLLNNSSFPDIKSN